MPAVARGDQHGVDIVAGKQFPEIAIHGTFGIAVLLIGRGFDRMATVGSHVGDGDEPNFRPRQKVAQHVAAAMANTDAAKEDLLAQIQADVGRDLIIS